MNCGGYNTPRIVNSSGDTNCYPGLFSHTGDSATITNHESFLILKMDAVQFKGLTVFSSEWFALHLPIDHIIEVNIYCLEVVSTNS